MEYNALLESHNYITRRNAVKVKHGSVYLFILDWSGIKFCNLFLCMFQLLGAMLLDRSNTVVMVRYVSSLDNMRIQMNLLRDSNKTIQLQAFHVFKVMYVYNFLHVMSFYFLSIRFLLSDGFPLILLNSFSLQIKTNRRILWMC